MKPPERVHVVPVGYEEDRIVEPATTQRADRVVLLEGGGAGRSKFSQNVRSRLKDEGIPVETVTCDIFDMHDVVSVTARVARRHEEDQVYVNVSTGSKISAIGGMLACMATEAIPYYVKPEKYTMDDSDPREPMSVGVQDIRSLPAYPIDAPEKQQLFILAYLNDKRRSATKKELIDFAEGEIRVKPPINPKEKLQFIEESETGSLRSKYRYLERDILDPLEDRDLVTVRRSGRDTNIDITEEGENILKVFRHVVEHD